MIIFVLHAKEKNILKAGQGGDLSRKIILFRDSSAVERSPVKRLVVGSIPTPGAKKQDLFWLPYTTKLEPISNKILTLTNEFRHATASAPPSTRSVLGSASAVSRPPSPHRLFILDLFCAGFLFFGMGGWVRAM